MIEGCLHWQTHGLAASETVQAATAAYLESEDMFGAWLDECCDCDANAWEASRQLFASWTAWAEQSGEQRGVPSNSAEGWRGAVFIPSGRAGRKVQEATRE
jgi:putative DNA primase/helicase